MDPEDLAEEAADELEPEVIVAAAVVVLLVLAAAVLLLTPVGGSVLSGGGQADAGAPAAESDDSGSENVATTDDQNTGSDTTTEQSGEQGSESVLLRESFDESSALEAWTVRGSSTRKSGENRGEASVTDGHLRLEVFRCYQLTVARDLGTQTGTIRVSFDWRSRAEGWWERPTWRLVDGNGDPYNYTVLSEHDLRRPPDHGSRSGRAVVEADVDGSVTIVYAIEPSRYCERSNHRTTSLTVDDLVVRRQNEAG